MEGQQPTTAATSAPEPRVISNSLSAAMQAGDSGGEEKTASFDDIFAPPETTDSGESTQAEPEKAAAPEAKQEEQPAPADDLLQQLAQEYGLNPADEKHKAVLEKLAAQQGQDTKEPEQDGSDDEFEALDKLIFGEEKPREGEVIPAPQQPVQQPLPPGKFGDVLDNTSTIEEAMQAYSEVWTFEPGEEPDYKKAGEVMNAIWFRQMVGMGVPVIQNMINQTLQSQLGDAIKFFRDQRAVAHRRQIYSRVVEGMSKQKGYEDINDLFEPLGDARIKVRSEVVDDTKLNRILREEPWILDIHREHADPDIALRKTHLARLQAAHKQYRKKNGSFPIAKAKQLVESGAEIERKKAADVARQRINAGPGATAAGAGNKNDDDLWFESIRNANGGRMAVKDLMSRGR